MYGMFYMVAEMLTPILLLPPIMALFGKKRGYATGRTLMCLLFALYLAAVFHLTGQPDLIYHRFEPNVYLVPFSEIIMDLRNSVLNVFLFIPLGFFLPTLGSEYRRFFRTFLFGFCMTVMVEVLQMFTLRTTDINDIITNVCGTALGWYLWKSLRKKLPGLLMANGGEDIRLCCCVSYFIMFFIQPFTYTFLWNLVMA